MKNNIKSKLIMASIIALCTFSAVSCSEKTDSDATGEASVTTSTVTGETTAQSTEAATEETTLPETEATTTTEVTTTVKADIPTNKEMLRYLSTKFGFMSDGSFEDDVKNCKSWEVIPEDLTVNPEDEATPEFLICAALRATNMIGLDASTDEILVFASERDVITEADLSAVNMSDWKGVIDRSFSAWINRPIENEISVELCDGVVDLNGVITHNDYVINSDDNTIELPSSVADKIKDATVVILPKNPETKEGGGYKIISQEERDGKIFIKAAAAEIAEIYKSISSN